MAAAPWRLLVRHRWTGEVVSVITGIARAKVGKATLNRPSTFGFVVPSDHPSVWHPASDGLPKIEEGVRTVHLLHWEPVPPWGDYAYVPRFSGPIWSMEDVGDENGVETLVSCVSPLHLYTKRPVQKADGSTDVVEFTNVPAQQIVQQLHDRTVATHGSVGLVLGTLETIAPRAMRWDNAHDLAAAFLELAGGFGGFDMFEEPLAGDVAGQTARLNVLQRKGSHRPLKIAWGVPPHTAKAVSRKKTMETVANDLRINGGAEWMRPHRTDAASKTKYGTMLGEDTIEDVTVPSFLEVLADEQIKLRSVPFESVSFTPTFRVAPWDELDIGDTFDVEAGERLRGGFKGVQRCYGFGYEIPDGSADAVITDITVKGETT